MTKIRATQALTPQGWRHEIDLVIAADGRIGSLRAAQGTADIHVDVLLPAPANLHSHSFQRAMAGLTESRGAQPNDSFWTWRRLMYRFLEQLTPDDVEAIAAQVFMEMAEAGYAAVAEFHYLHHAPGGKAYDAIAEMSERIAGAASQTGLGLTHLPVHYEFGGCDKRALKGGQQRFGTTKPHYEALYTAAEGLITNGPADWALGAAAHSLRAVDVAGLDLTRDLAGSGPFHMHLAEQTAEVDDVKAHLGARPVQWVLDNTPVNAQSCFIHCTQMTGAETMALAQSGAVAGLCPITESSLGDGIFSGMDYQRAQGRFGVGSDSNIHISLWDELKTLEYSQRLKHCGRAMFATPALSTGRVLFDAVCKGGAQAAGRKSGALAAGHWADLIGLDAENEFLSTRSEDAILDSLVFSGGGRNCIDHVWSAGRHLVKNGRHTAREAITKRFIATLNGLKQAI